MPRRAKIIPFPGVTLKHPPPSEPPSAPASLDAEDLVEVYRCDQAEAIVVRSFLESTGIPTLLRSRLVASIHPFTVGAQGEVVVLVSESAASRSRRLLARMGSRRFSR